MNPKYERALCRYARRMIAHPSPIERKVTRYLIDLDQDFLPQEIIGPYIVDFLHPEWHLIIECDGYAYHSMASARDKDVLRDQFLMEKGYHILHLMGWQCWNEDVCKGLITDFIRAHVVSAEAPPTERPGGQTVEPAADRTRVNQRVRQPLVFQGSQPA